MSWPCQKAPQLWLRILQLHMGDLVSDDPVCHGGR